jgi:hypothetical protein
MIFENLSRQGLSDLKVKDHENTSWAKRNEYNKHLDTNKKDVFRDN